MSIKDQAITVNEAAALCGKSRSFIQNDLKERGLKTPKIKLGEFVRMLVEYFEERIKTEKLGRRTNLQDLRAAKLSRELVDAQWAINLFTENHVSLRAALEGMPAVMTRDLELRKAMLDHIHKIFKEHHERIQRELSQEEAA